MKISWSRALTWLAVILFFSAPLAGTAAERSHKGPVAMIMQAQGSVEYTKNGKKWKKVRQNKFLFLNYQVRTGTDGSATLINQRDGASRTIGANSRIEIVRDDVRLISGTLSDPKSGEGTLIAGLSNRFKTAQKYTTVRRGIKKKGIILRTATNRKKSPFRISALYPDLVWSNPGPEYRYRLTIDNTVHEIAPTTDDIVRFSIAEAKPGKHLYKVVVLKQDHLIYQPKRSSSFIWLNHEEMKQIDVGAPGESLLRALYLDGEGLLVASMDLYRQYFSKNRDDNDMRPMLIQNYHKLKLTQLKKREASTYNAMLQEEE